MLIHAEDVSHVSIVMEVHLIRTLKFIRELHSWMTTNAWYWNNRDFGQRFRLNLLPVKAFEEGMRLDLLGAIALLHIFIKHLKILYNS